jgi:hypothetical protein
MVKKPTLILLGILVLLVAFAFWSQKNPTIFGSEATATPTSIPNPLADWTFDDTRLIQYETSVGQPITLRMGKDINSWTVDQNKDLQVDSGKVMQLLSELESINPITRLGDSIDESAMGLGKDAGKIILVNANGATREILIGKETVTASGTYIRCGEDYYIINSPTVQNINRLLSMEGIARVTETPTLVSSTPRS